MNLAQHIEAILFFKNEPISLTALSKLLDAKKSDVEKAVAELQVFYQDRGIVLITTNDEITFGTHPSTSTLIERIQKDELSRELGRAGLETLAIILYKGPVSRREIDYIRGVNSGFIIRNLLVRGLIERTESKAGERSFSYRPTLELLRFLGITKREELPEFKTAFAKIQEFAATETDDHAHQ